MGKPLLPQYDQDQGRQSDTFHATTEVDRVKDRKTTHTEKTESKAKKERSEGVGLRTTRYYDPRSAQMCFNCLTVSRRVQRSKLCTRAG